MYAMMWNENSPFEFTGLFPGQEGIGSGVGFQLGTTPFTSQILLLITYNYSTGGREISFVALHLSKYGLRTKTTTATTGETSDASTSDDQQKPKEQFHVESKVTF